MSKIQFWKQFTTNTSFMRWKRMLYSICQRYNFESNLQPVSRLNKSIEGCIRYVKDTILKAIYNTSLAIYLNKEAVFDMSKIQFWKQFTTPTNKRITFIGCIRYVKDTILKAIYNIQESHPTCERLYSICQRYNIRSKFTTCVHACVYFGMKYTVLFKNKSILNLIFNYNLDIPKNSIVKEVFSTQSFEIIFYKFWFQTEKPISYVKKHKQNIFHFQVILSDDKLYICKQSIAVFKPL